MRRSDPCPLLVVVVVVPLIPVRGNTCIPVHDSISKQDDSRHQRLASGRLLSVPRTVSSNGKRANRIVLRLLVARVMDFFPTRHPWEWIGGSRTRSHSFTSDFRSGFHLKLFPFSTRNSLLFRGEFTHRGELLRSSSYAITFEGREEESASLLKYRAARFMRDC